VDNDLIIETIKILHHAGVAVLLSGVNPDIKDQAKKCRLTDVIAEDMICEDFNGAIRKACDILGSPVPEMRYG
jgi:hypothetical protein